MPSSWIGMDLIIVVRSSALKKDGVVLKLRKHNCKYVGTNFDLIKDAVVENIVCEVSY